MVERCDWKASSLRGRRLCLVAVLALPAPAAAVDLLRVGVGGGYVHAVTSEDGGPTVVQIDDAVYDIEIALGWRFAGARHVLFQLGWTGSVVPEPNTSIGQRAGTLSWAAGGPGVTGYFGQSGVVASGGIYLASITYEEPGYPVAYAPLTLMPRVALGYEWQVAEGLRLNLSARSSAFTVDSSPGLSTWLVTAGVDVSVVFGGGPPPSR